MKYILIPLLIFMLLVSCGLQYAPAEAQEPEPTPAPVKPDVQLIRMLPPIEIVPVAAPEPEPEPEIIIDPYEAELIAKTLYGEYRGADKLQQAGVVWCILNRCDAWGETVEAVVTAAGQFHGYSPKHPVLDYLYDMAVDVLTRHEREKLGETDVGRVLPADYLWFGGDGVKNHFRDKFSGGNKWQWTLPNPYEEVNNATD